MRLGAHAGLLATLFWCRDAYASLYADVAQLPSTTFDFIVVGGMFFFPQVVLVVLTVALQEVLLAMSWLGGSQKTQISLCWLLRLVYRAYIVMLPSPY